MNDKRTDDIKNENSREHWIALRKIPIENVI